MMNSGNRQSRSRVQGGWADSGISKVTAQTSTGSSSSQHHTCTSESFLYKDPKVHKMASQRPYNFSWLIDGVLAGSGLPSQTSHLQYLVDNGIKHLVSLTEWKPALYATPGLNHIHMAVREFEPPSLKQVHDFVTLVENAREKNQPVCVHCHWGLGRTGTMLACFILKSEKISPNEAIQYVRAKRKYSIETYEQENLVHQYAKYLEELPADM